MCKESATAYDVRAARPHPGVGSAADPIALEPVDEVVVTTLVANVYGHAPPMTRTCVPSRHGTGDLPIFQTGHEGSIPFAHSSPRNPRSVA